MSKEPLTHSDRYVRKTNRIILIVGIITLFLFLFGLLLLTSEAPEEASHTVFEDTIDAETNLGMTGNTSAEVEIDFEDAEQMERPITLTPNPINMGKVVLGNEATNVLTIGTNGKVAIRIVKVEPEDAISNGFSYVSNCDDKELRGKITCMVTMKWLPTMPANFQNNFKITWHETNVSERNAKHDEVPVYGSAVTQEDCNYCDTPGTGGTTAGIGAVKTEGHARYAVGPDGNIIGVIGEDGTVYDFNGNAIGKVDANGMILDDGGNIIGVASGRKLIMDANGNVIGYVDANGDAYDRDGNKIGKMLSDGTVVDSNGTILGKAINSGYVYDSNGNIIGRVLEDGSVVNAQGEVIGRINENGEVVDKNGNILGRVANSGEVVFDENGNPIGIVMPNGEIVDENGNVVGHMRDGKAYKLQQVGKRGSTSRLAYDLNGNVIGYLDENGNVIDENGNIVGHTDKFGNIIDANGNIIGRSSRYGAAVDANGNVIGYIDENGNVRDFDGNLIGYLDENGNIIDENGTIIGRADSKGIAFDSNGNVIGYIDENGNVINGKGNIIGKVDENGNVIDENGNIIGNIGADWVDLSLDENGKVNGFIDGDGIAYGLDGQVFGYVDENGNVIGGGEKIFVGKKGDEVQLALDENGNVIGYIDENGIVRDFSGNEIGTYKDGIIYDADGNVIGKGGDRVNLALDENGNVVGYINDKNIAYDKSGKIMGIADVNGNVVTFGLKRIGSLLNKNLLPIAPDGSLLGTINNRGEVVDQNKVIGRMHPNGLVTDKSGAKILAQGVEMGFIANWGCNYEYKLDERGVVVHNGEDTNMRVYPNGTVWAPDGQYVGSVIKTGHVYDNQCNYIGEAQADGYVRNLENREVGCINPDGSVLDLERPQIKGHVVEPKVVYDPLWQEAGMLDEGGMLYDYDGEPVGCMNSNREVYDRENGSYMATISDAYYAFDFNGKLLGLFDEEGRISIDGQEGAQLYVDNLIINKNKKIIGFATPKVNILIDGQGNILGHLFADGNVYNSNGEVVDKISGRGTGLYGGIPAKFLQTGHVVDVDGQSLGLVNYDLNVVDIKGSTIGKIDAKGRIYGENGRQIGGLVKQGAAQSYDGMNLGYVVATGEVINFKELADASGNEYQVGDVTGYVVPDGHVVRDGDVIGEIVPQTVMIDMFGNYVGYSDINGDVRNIKNQGITTMLPGGATVDNISILPQGFVIDFGGNIIGVVLPNGRFMDTKRSLVGKVLGDGKVVGDDGKLFGEVVNGDIVIGNDDKVKGLVGFDGKVYRGGTIVGRILTDGLAVDTQNNVLGHVYNIGNTILSNQSEYVGRLAANGKVIENKNKEIGFIKSNGSFIDADKNVAGYLLPEVAKNRRN